ncbi:MAG TPA: ThiF family adenylyltransferase, partial [Acidobacteriota bacterium]|nr:ThiF family adenylyltransferase [Acidobacteriota bacterium]
EPEEAEADTFARQIRVPGHSQEALASARVAFIGAGGLNSWNALGAVRSGLRNLTVIDPDIAERTNLTRQLYYADDLGQPKAHRLARNLLPHMTAGGTVTAIALGFEEALEDYPLAADLLVVGVDNNACRLEAARFATAQRIPAVFSMLSLDGMRTQSFLQGPDKDDSCLWCALPNLDPETSAPCRRRHLKLLSGLVLRPLLPPPRPDGLAGKHRAFQLAGVRSPRQGRGQPRACAKTG